MGTPDFAVPALQALHDAGHEVAAVVTRPDAKSNRGNKIHFSPVKEKALELGIPVLQPVKLRGNEEILEELSRIAPDVIINSSHQVVDKEHPASVLFDAGLDRGQQCLFFRLIIYDAVVINEAAPTVPASDIVYHAVIDRIDIAELCFCLADVLRPRRLTVDPFADAPVRHFP